MTDRPSEPSGLIGEENVDKPTSPAKNLLAAAFLAVLAVVATVLAVRMPNPGDAASHPGLLPALTGVSLLLMALGLGIGAIRAGALQRTAPGPDEAASSAERASTAALVAIIVGYVVALDAVAFELGFEVAGMRLAVGSFECVTVPVLTLVLRLFWRASWRRCLAVSAPVVIGLAGIFRYGFVILLPGS